MKSAKSIICLFTALCLLCPLLWGCASPGPAEPESTAVSRSLPEESGELSYAASYSLIESGSGNYLGYTAGSDKGYYAVDYAANEAEESDTGEEAAEESYDAIILFVSYEGGAAKLEGYSPVEPPEELRGLTDFYASHDILGLTAEEDGSLICVETLYMSWYAGHGERPDEYGTAYDDFRRDIYIRRLSPDGEELSCALLSLEEDEQLFAQDLVTDSQGRLILSGGSSLYFYTPEGERAGELDMGGYVKRVYKAPGGEIAAICYDDGGREVLHYISDENMGIDRSHFIPAGGFFVSLGGEDYDLYYSDGESYIGYELESGESKALFNWVSCGVNINNLSAVQLLEGGGFRCVSCGYDSAEESYFAELIDIMPRSGSGDTQQCTLRLGSIYPETELIDSIIAFNRSNADCKVELIDYSRRYELSEGAQMDALMAELMGGSMPDILDLGGLNWKLLAAKGLFEDLYPWLDSDGQLSREKFFPNILSLCEHRGELVALCAGFSIETVLGSAEKLGEEPGWSYDEYRQALAEAGEGCLPFEVYTTSREIMQSGLAMELDSYVNWDELSADFDNESFRGLLAFADSFPDSFDWDNYEWTDADIVEYRIAGGRQLLLRCALYSAEEIYYNSIYFNGAPSYIGYPTHDGSAGSMLSLNSLYAISGESAHKNEAWRFVSGLLGDESQGSLWGFPGRADVFERQLEALMSAEYLTDAGGEVVLDDEGQQTELARGYMGTVLGVRSCYAFSEAQAQQLREIIESCSRRKSGEDQLIALVLEAVMPCFAGGVDESAAIAAAEAAAEQYLSVYK